MSIFRKLLRNDFGAIESAIYRNDEDALQALAASGADFTATDKDGTTTLMVALNAEGTSPEVLSFVLRRSGDINAVDKSGWTALHFAARNQKRDHVAVLLAAGAKVNVVDTYGNTPLLKATTSRCDALIVRDLLEAGADPLLENKTGVSAMSLAKTLRREDLHEMFDK